jgi:hypothetical protein
VEPWTKIIDDFRNIAKAPKISMSNFGKSAVEFPQQSHKSFVIQATYMTPLKHATISRRKITARKKIIMRNSTTQSHSIINKLSM